MPRVTVTAYELDHDLLPPVCVKCGQPATVRLDRTTRVIDEPGRWYGFYTVVVVVSIFFFPPLFLFLLRRAKAVRFRIPFCGPDLARTMRRERWALRVLVPVWCLWALLADTALVLQLFSRHSPWFCAMAGAMAVVVAMGEVGTAWLRRRRRKPPVAEYNLPNVHPAFIAALSEDRARDRVDNPFRRGGRGDVRDDFDDEPV
jgi:hypothetical protein